MTTLNTIIEEEKNAITHKYDLRYFDGSTYAVSEEFEKDLTTAMQRAYEAGYKLAVEHLKEAYAHNGTTTVPEAIEWLEDNSKYQDKK